MQNFDPYGIENLSSHFITLILVAVVYTSVFFDDH